MNCDVGGVTFISSSTTNADVNTSLRYASAETNTSKHNTDAITAQTNSASFAQATNYTRSQTINGIPADLPNAPSLCHVYRLKDFIDSLDPTASANPTKKLSNWGFGGSYYNKHVWSSSQSISDASVGVLYDGTVGRYNKQGGAFGVIPVLEIPA